MGDWISLDNGVDLSGWGAKREHAWRVVGQVRPRPDDDRSFLVEPGTGVLVNGDGHTADLHTTLEHGSCELHLEFCVPARSNSGVYLQGQYEIQILDSWGTPDAALTYQSCGAIYGRWIEETKTSYDGYPPRVNASRRPGEWQSYDIVFRAPRFDTSGRQVARARFERVLHNGVLIHEQVECSGPTRGAWNPRDIARGPLRLQGDHGPVAYRDIRMRPLPD